MMMCLCRFVLIRAPLRYRTAQIGVQIVQEGQVGQSLFLVLSGKLSVKVMDASIGIEHKVNLLERGEFFGELALLHGSAAAASVYAQTPAEVLEISHDDCRRLNLAHVLRQDTQERETIIKWLFKDVHLFNVAQVARYARLRRCRSGEIITRQNDRSQWLFILKRGAVRVRKKFNLASVLKTRQAALIKQIEACRLE